MRLRINSIPKTNNGPVLLFKTIFRHWHCFLSSVATDGKDEHGFKFEKLGSNFSGFNVKIRKTLLWFVLSNEI